jgi:hypothetical protein
LSSLQQQFLRGFVEWMWETGRYLSRRYGSRGNDVLSSNDSRVSSMQQQFLHGQFVGGMWKTGGDRSSSNPAAIITANNYHSDYAATAATTIESMCPRFLSRLLIRTMLYGEYTWVSGVSGWVSWCEQISDLQTAAVSSETSSNSTADHHSPPDAGTNKTAGDDPADLSNATAGDGPADLSNETTGDDPACSTCIYSAREATGIYSARGPTGIYPAREATTGIY